MYTSKNSRSVTLGGGPGEFARLEVLSVFVELLGGGGGGAELSKWDGWANGGIWILERGGEEG